MMTSAQLFYYVVLILGNALAALLILVSSGLFAYCLLIATILYSIVGFYDLFFSSHSLNQLYPVLAYIRYALESFRTEIQQYYIANNIEEMPFNREQRDLVYRRAKGVTDTLPFGTQRDLMQANYQSIWHSLAPTKVDQTSRRVKIGGPDCTQPYSSSLFNISAMSYGAISAEAIEALNKGAQLGDFYHNTGEGGLSPHHLKHGGDIVWQIGTGLFGCRNANGRFDPDAFAKLANLEQVKMIEVKLSQGAKPGHGGVLPKAKITDEIALIRGIKKGEDCVSPAVNPECDTPLALLEFVQQLRTLANGKPIGIKLCIGNPAEFLCLGKAMIESNIFVDFITVDGAEGGTGAAPVEFSNRLGMMCIEGTYLVHNALLGLGIRDKITVIAAGKTATGFDILNKLAYGADVVNAARTFMLALGCIQSRHCDSNKCPTGIATQDKNRSKAINVELKSQRVASFQKLTLKSCYDLVGSMGLDDMTKLTQSMIKVRMPNGLLDANSLSDFVLEHKELIRHCPKGMWDTWWQQASSHSFQIEP